MQVTVAGILMGAISIILNTFAPAWLAFWIGVVVGFSISLYDTESAKKMEKKLLSIFD